MFMKGFIIGAVLLNSYVVCAEPLNVNVRNFNFTYANPHGEGTATSFSRSQLFNEELKVTVDKIDKDFKLNVSGAETQEFEFKNAPSFMTDAQTMNVSNFNLTLQEKLNLSLASGRFNSPENSLKLDGLNLDCGRDVNQAEVMDQLISGCIQKMTLKSSKFQSQEAEETLAAVISETISKAIDGSDVTVNSVDLRTNAGKYDLSAEVKAQVSGKVKSNGNMSYDPASGKLTLKISEVKFSILNITGKVFEELKKKESDKLKVKEPYVYYTVK
jgi:hypothetical protein